MDKTREMIFVCLAAAPLVLLSACGKQQSDTAPEAAMDKPVATNAMSDVEMGLSKASVFDTPDPQTVTYSDKYPGSNELLTRAYPDAPPLIPHNIDSFKPITTKNNACIGCHHNFPMRGKQVAKGIPTPMSASHYTDLRHKPDAESDQLVGGRYVCTQCHVVQASVDQLVENSFTTDP